MLELIIGSAYFNIPEAIQKILSLNTQIIDTDALIRINKIEYKLKMKINKDHENMPAAIFSKVGTWVAMFP